MTRDKSEKPLKMFASIATASRKNLSGKKQRQSSTFSPLTRQEAKANFHLRCTRCHTCTQCNKELFVESFAGAMDKCRSCMDRVCDVCAKSLPTHAFPASQIHNAGNPNQNFHLRCTSCHTCTQCNKKLLVENFDGAKDKCRNCTVWQCDACTTTKPATEFDSAVLNHAQTYQRARVCRVCEHSGVSPRDLRTYACEGCGPRGHLKFSRDALNNSKRGDRASRLVCVDCGARQQRTTKLLQLKHAWKCTCPGAGQQKLHIPSRENCQLYARQAGERRWAGKNVGVTEDDLEHLARVKRQRR